MQMRLIALGFMLGLAACDMGHLGNPLGWPGSAVGNGIENASYAARRKHVTTHVAAHYSGIITDIKIGGGPALTQAADLAGVAATNRPELLRSLQNDHAKFTPDTPEARERLVIWLMVHGN